MLFVGSTREYSFHMVQHLKGCTPHDKKLNYASFLQTRSLSTIKQR